MKFGELAATLPRLLAYFTAPLAPYRCETCRVLLNEDQVVTSYDGFGKEHRYHQRGAIDATTIRVCPGPVVRL